ncbi:MAG: efflux transporter outer membrane subunit [Comamonas sp.]|nr:efflux transporter outer membrane subunit [Comamonas sp.]
MKKDKKSIAASACWISATAIFSSILSACNFAPSYERPSGMVPPNWEPTAQTAPVAPTAPTSDHAPWLQSIGWVQDARLRQTLTLALEHNRDLRVALANVEKARAQYGITRADLLPSIHAQAQGTRSRTSADLGNTGQASIGEQYSAQLGFTSYELDLWGRVRNLSAAGLESFLQSQANQRNVQIGLLAEVGNAWLNVAADMARLQLAQDTLATREKSYALNRRMLELGAISGLALAQNLSSVESARGDVAAYTAQVARSRNALQLLLGSSLPPDLLPSAETLVEDTAHNLALLPGPPALPSSVLLQRPDVQAAEHQLRAMQANIGAARAALFPSITLTGSVGSASRELDALFASGNGTWSFMPQIKLPIFDGGRLRAGVEVAQANQRIALAQYEKTVQTAFREVADTLADRAQWGTRLGAQTGTVHATQKTLQLSEARFQAGMDSYLSVLDAQRSLYSAQQTLIGLRLAEQQNRITLWKALGGAESANASAELANPHQDARP